MRNDEVAPINHGVLSSTGTVAVEAGNKGLWGMLGGALAFPLFTGLLLGGLVTGGLLWGGAALSTVAAVGIGASVVGAAAGAVGGFILPIIPAIAGLGAIAGVARGVSHGAGRISQEKGAANQLSAQVSAMQAQAIAMQAAASQPQVNDPSFPAQGSRFNPCARTMYAAANDNAYANEAARAGTEGTVQTPALAVGRS